ncbi:MAG: hypothetical protein ACRDSR_11895 [Pseudonocardiaceae bacterium]
MSATVTRTPDSPAGGHATDGVGKLGALDPPDEGGGPGRTISRVLIVSYNLSVQVKVRFI